MKPARFVYHRPASVQEALEILAEVAPQDGRVLAGGQSLVPMMAFRLATPPHLVDINRIGDFSRLAITGDAISIAACVRHAAFERIETPGPTGALLNAVARHVAHWPIRTRGSFCGSLAHADPAAEWCLVAMTLGATLIARSVNATRAVAAADFFTGVMSTALRSDEILVEARLPLLPADARWSFVEFSRRAGDFAIASVLVAGRLRDGAIRDARLGVGGAEPAPRRLAEVEALLEGRPPDPGLFAQAAVQAAESIEPMEDAVNGADYRRDLVRALTRRALTQAFA